MRAVVQRVQQASVTIADDVVGKIGVGLLALIGAGHGDSIDDAKYLVDKLTGLRIFSDDAGQMNRSVVDVGGALLLVSQFTLYGDVRKGRRPSFTDAMLPGPAEVLYDELCRLARNSGVPVETGRFRADMQVALVNDGPVTLLLDSRRAF